MSNLSGGFEVPCKIEGGDVCKNSIVATWTTNRSTCPYGLLTTNIAMV
jgi:hypothetical protein